jgi:hypothetical protein
MNIFRINVKKTKEIPNNNGGVHKTIRSIINELELCKANNIHVNGDVITFKNNAWEWRLDVNIMGILKEGKFKLTEDKDSIIVSFETYYSILGDFLTFLPLVFIVSVVLNDMMGLLFLLGIAFGIIIKKAIVSTKLEDIFEKL